MNSSINYLKIEPIIKSLPTKKTLSSEGSTICQTFKDRNNVNQNRAGKKEGTGQMWKNTSHTEKIYATNKQR